MQIDIISVLPDLLRSPFDHSIVSRAVKSGKVRINLHNLRDYSTNKYKQVDDYAYGGEAGMVLMPEPLANCIENLQSTTTYDEVIYLCPDGTRLEQKMVNQLSLKQNFLLICGHYKGIDERIREQFVTKEISIGDYVLSGGELAAAVLVDAMVRLIPGVLSDEVSALTDSFQDNLLSHPVYTRPEDFRGSKVPDVLLSGNHKHIETWRLEQAIKRTSERRPDLLGNG